MFQTLAEYTPDWPATHSEPFWLVPVAPLRQHPNGDEAHSFRFQYSLDRWPVHRPRGGFRIGQMVNFPWGGEQRQPANLVPIDWPVGAMGVARRCLTVEPVSAAQNSVAARPHFRPAMPRARLAGLGRSGGKRMPIGRRLRTAQP